MLLNSVFLKIIQATLDQLSEELSKDYDEKLNSSEDLVQSFEMRSKLPVFAKKAEILEVIKKNSIVIIQGSTGCGKTTQVSYNTH
jgi:ATP-dependent RNA helicase A